MKENTAKILDLEIISLQLAFVTLTKEFEWPDLKIEGTDTKRLQLQHLKVFLRLFGQLCHILLQRGGEQG